MNRRNIQEVTVWHVWKAIGDSQGQALYNGLLLTMATTFLQLGHPTLLAWPSHNITLTSHDFNPGHPTIAWAYLPGLEANIFNDRDQFYIDPGPVQVKRSQDLPRLEAKIFNDRDQFNKILGPCKSNAVRITIPWFHIINIDFPRLAKIDRPRFLDTEISTRMLTTRVLNFKKGGKYNFVHQCKYFSVLSNCPLYSTSSPTRHSYSSDTCLFRYYFRFVYNR